MRSKMKNYITKNAFIRKLLSYEIIIALVIGLCAIFLSLKVFHESPHGLFSNSIPLAGDGLLIGIYIKLALQASWLNVIFQNINSSSLGWPGNIDFSSYPIGNTLEILLIKIYSQIFNVYDPGQIIHFFSIFKSFLISIAMYYLARTIGIKKLPSCFIALAFALSTYNLVRAEGHFLLSLTWSIPLMLTSIIFAYKLGNSEITPGKKNTLILFFSAAFASLSSFYYSFFLLLCNLCVLIFILMNSDTNPIRNKRIAIKHFIKKAKYSLLVLVIQISGVLFQVLPILLRNRNLNSLTGVGDRSPLESLIYSGNLESLFFDLSKVGLNFIRRPDLVNFTQTKISWEGSQIGLISGSMLILLILTAIYRLMLLIFDFTPNRRYNVLYKLPTTRLLMLFLFISLLFYFPSPVNFLTSQIFPQIRAWGRLSIFISIFTLLLLGVFLSSRFVSSKILIVLIMILSLSFVYELSIFAKSRPPSSALASISSDNDKNFRIAIDDLKTIYVSNCSLVNLPLYPFPEFDISDDSNGDYSLLDLPIRDTGIFKWSYGGIKATENFSQWQSLISEFPPFYRAGIDHQVNRGYLSGACGVVIDKTYLINQEKIDLANLVNNKIYPCTRDLLGPKFNEESRYVSIQFNSNNCRPKFSTITKDEVQDNLNSQEILWRYDEGTSVGFQGIRQVFNINSSVVMRFYAPKSIPNYELRIQLFGKDLNQVNLCLKSSRVDKYRCAVQQLSSNGTGRLSIPPSMLMKGINKLTINLEAIHDKEILGWSVSPGFDSK
jgi:hypothetical protein